MLVFDTALDVVGKHNRTVAQVRLKDLDDLRIHGRSPVEQYNVYGVIGGSGWAPLENDYHGT